MLRRGRIVWLVDRWDVVRARARGKDREAKMEAMEEILRLNALEAGRGLCRRVRVVAQQGVQRPEAEARARGAAVARMRCCEARMPVG